jgi:hypothetical protein
MADKSVVRNKQYKRGGLSVRQRHNERQNADYMNEDIIKDRAVLNVHFKQPQGSYEKMFDTMLAELVFDINMVLAYKCGQFYLKIKGKDVCYIHSNTFPLDCK